MAYVISKELYDFCKYVIGAEPPGMFPDRVGTVADGVITFADTMTRDVLPQLQLGTQSIRDGVQGRADAAVAAQNERLLKLLSTIASALRKVGEDLKAGVAQIKVSTYMVIFIAIELMFEIAVALVMAYFFPGVMSHVVMRLLIGRFKIAAWLAKAIYAIALSQGVGALAQLLIIGGAYGAAGVPIDPKVLLDGLGASAVGALIGVGGGFAAGGAGAALRRVRGGAGAARAVTRNSGKDIPDSLPLKGAGAKDLPLDVPLTGAGAKDLSIDMPLKGDPAKDLPRDVPTKSEIIKEAAADMALEGVLGGASEVGAGAAMGDQVDASTFTSASFSEATASSGEHVGNVLRPVPPAPFGGWPRDNDGTTSDGPGSKLDDIVSTVDAVLPATPTPSTEIPAVPEAVGGTSPTPGAARPEAGDPELGQWAEPGGAAAPVAAGGSGTAPVAQAAAGSGGGASPAGRPGSATPASPSLAEPAAHGSASRPAPIGGVSTAPSVASSGAASAAAVSPAAGSASAAGRPGAVTPADPPGAERVSGSPGRPAPVGGPNTMPAAAGQAGPAVPGATASSGAAGSGARPSSVSAASTAPGTTGTPSPVSTPPAASSPGNPASGAAVPSAATDAAAPATVLPAGEETSRPGPDAEDRLGLRPRSSSLHDTVSSTHDGGAHDPSLKVVSGPARSVRGLEEAGPGTAETLEAHPDRMHAAGNDGSRGRWDFGRGRAAGGSDMFAAETPSDATEEQIASAHPWLKKVNPYRTNSAKEDAFNLNCVITSIATDMSLAEGVGHQASGVDVPSGPDESPGLPENHLANYQAQLLGLPDGESRVHVMGSLDAVRDVMSAAPLGSRGIVLVRGAGATSHAFNVVRDERGVNFVDGQRGGLARRPETLTEVSFLPLTDGIDVPDGHRTITLTADQRAAGAPVPGNMVTNSRFRELVSGTDPTAEPTMEKIRDLIAKDRPPAFVVNTILPLSDVIDEHQAVERGKAPTIDVTKIRAVVQAIKQDLPSDIEVAFVLGINDMGDKNKTQKNIKEALRGLEKELDSLDAPVAVGGYWAGNAGEEFKYGEVRNWLLRSKETKAAIRGYGMPREDRDSRYPYVSFQDFDTSRRTIPDGTHVFKYLEREMNVPPGPDEGQLHGPLRPLAISGGYRVAPDLIARTEQRLKKELEKRGEPKKKGKATARTSSREDIEAALKLIKSKDFLAEFERRVLDDMATRDRMAAIHPLVPYSPETNFYVDGLSVLREDDIKFSNRGAEYDGMADGLSKTNRAELEKVHQSSRDDPDAPEGSGIRGEESRGRRARIATDLQNNRHPVRGVTLLSRFREGAAETDLSRLAMQLALDNSRLPQSHVDNLSNRDKSLYDASADAHSGIEKYRDSRAPDAPYSRLEKPDIVQTKQDGTPERDTGSMRAVWKPDPEDLSKLGPDRPLQPRIAPADQDGYARKEKAFLAHLLATSSTEQTVLQEFRHAGAIADSAEHYLTGPQKAAQEIRRNEQKERGEVPVGFEIPVRAGSLYDVVGSALRRDPAELRRVTLDLDTDPDKRQLASKIAEMRLRNPYAPGHFFRGAVSAPPAVLSRTDTTDPAEVEQFKNADEAIATALASAIQRPIVIRDPARGDFGATPLSSLPGSGPVEIERIVYNGRPEYRLFAAGKPIGLGEITSTDQDSAAAPDQRPSPDSGTSVEQDLAQVQGSAPGQEPADSVDDPAADEVGNSAPDQNATDSGAVARAAPGPESGTAGASVRAAVADPVTTTHYDVARGEGASGPAFRRTDPDLTLAESAGRAADDPPMVLIHRHRTDDDHPELRISEDGTIAVNNGQGEAGEVYATREVLDDARRRLKEANSGVDLKADPGHTITLRRGGVDRALVRITPDFFDDVTDVCRDLAMAVTGEDPNQVVFRGVDGGIATAAVNTADSMIVGGTHDLAAAMAEQAVGGGDAVGAGPGWATMALGDATSAATPKTLPGEAYGRALGPAADSQAEAPMSALAREVGVNEYAWAEVGEAYVAQSIATPTTDAADPGSPDYGANHVPGVQPAARTFGYHFAAVVLRSADGRSQVTLENYGRPRTDELADAAVARNLETLGDDLPAYLDRAKRAAQEAQGSERAGLEARAAFLERLEALRSAEAAIAATTEPDPDAVARRDAAKRFAALALLQLSGRNGLPNPKDLWHFRLFSRRPGESFHDVVTGTGPGRAPGIVVNPLTVVVAGGHQVAPVDVDFAEGSRSLTDQDTQGLEKWARDVVRVAIWNRRTGMPLPAVNLNAGGNGTRWRSPFRASRAALASERRLATLERTVRDAIAAEIAVRRRDGLEIAIASEEIAVRRTPRGRAAVPGTPPAGMSNRERRRRARIDVDAHPEPAPPPPKVRTMTRAKPMVARPAAADAAAPAQATPRPSTWTVRESAKLVFEDDRKGTSPDRLARWLRAVAAPEAAGRAPLDPPLPPADCLIRAVAGYGALYGKLPPLDADATAALTLSDLEAAWGADFQPVNDVGLDQIHQALAATPNATAMFIIAPLGGSMHAYSWVGGVANDGAGRRGVVTEMDTQVPGVSGTEVVRGDAREERLNHPGSRFLLFDEHGRPSTVSQLLKRPVTAISPSSAGDRPGRLAEALVDPGRGRRGVGLAPAEFPDPLARTVPDRAPRPLPRQAAGGLDEGDALPVLGDDLGGVVRAPANGECLLYATLMSDPRKVAAGLRHSQALLDSEVDAWLSDPARVRREGAELALDLSEQGSLARIANEQTPLSRAADNLRLAALLKLDELHDRANRDDEDHQPWPPALLEHIKYALDDLRLEPFRGTTPKGRQATRAQVLAFLRSAGVAPGSPEPSTTELRRQALDIASMTDVEHAPNGRLSDVAFGKLRAAVHGWGDSYDTPLGEVFLPLLAYALNLRLQSVLWAAKDGSPHEPERVLAAQTVGPAGAPLIRLYHRADHYDASAPVERQTTSKPAQVGQQVAGEGATAGRAAAQGGAQVRRRVARARTIAAVAPPPNPAPRTATPTQQKLERAVSELTGWLDAAAPLDGSRSPDAREIYDTAIRNVADFMRTLTIAEDVTGDMLGDVGGRGGPQATWASILQEFSWLTRQQSLWLGGGRAAARPAEVVSRLRGFVALLRPAIPELAELHDRGTRLTRRASYLDEVIDVDFQYDRWLDSDIGRSVSLDPPPDPLFAAVRNVDIGSVPRTQEPDGAGGIWWRTDRQPLFRQDTRAPHEIFSTGFDSWNSTNPLSFRRYVKWVDKFSLVSTTRSKHFAATWQPNAGRKYVYEIDAPGGIDIVATLKRENHVGQQEVVFPGGIRAEFITRCWWVDENGTQHVMDNPNRRTSALPATGLAAPPVLISSAPLPVSANADEPVLGIADVTYPASSRPGYGGPYDGARLPSVVHRGEFEVEQHEGKPHVRIYTVAPGAQNMGTADPVTRIAPSTLGDVRQDPASGQLEFGMSTSGRQTTVIGGRPLAALKIAGAMERVQQDVGVPVEEETAPVIRSFLIPLNAYQRLSENALAVDDPSTELAARNIRPELEANIFSLTQEVLASDIAPYAVPGSLVTYTDRPDLVAPSRGAGDVRHAADLREALSVPEQRLSIDDDPWPRGRELQDSSVDLARVAEIASRLRRHLATWRQAQQPDAARTADPLTAGEEQASFNQRRRSVEAFLRRHDVNPLDVTTVDRFIAEVVQPWADQAGIAVTMLDDYHRMRWDLTINDDVPDVAFAAQREGREARSDRLRRLGGDLEEMWSRPGDPTRDMIDHVIVQLPELASRFDEIAVWNERYTYYEHVQMVLGQYRKLVGDRPGAWTTAIAKAIIFHDIDKVNSKLQFGTGEAERHDAEAEHVLAVQLMDRYQEIFGSEQEKRLARRLVDSDPFGFYLRGKHDADEVFAFIDSAVTEVYGSADPARVREIYHAAHQYYQADFSSYTSDSSYHPRPELPARGGLPSFDGYFVFGGDGRLGASNGRFRYAEPYASKIARLDAMFASDAAVATHQQRLAARAEQDARDDAELTRLTLADDPFAHGLGVAQRFSADFVDRTVTARLGGSDATSRRRAQLEQMYATAVADGRLRTTPPADAMAQLTRLAARSAVAVDSSAWLRAARQGEASAVIAADVLTKALIAQGHGRRSGIFHVLLDRDVATEILRDGAALRTPLPVSALALPPGPGQVELVINSSDVVAAGPPGAELLFLPSTATLALGSVPGAAPTPSRWHATANARPVPTAQAAAIARVYSGHLPGNSPQLLELRDAVWVALAHGADAATANAVAERHAVTRGLGHPQQAEHHRQPDGASAAPRDLLSTSVQFANGRAELDPHLRPSVQDYARRVAAEVAHRWRAGQRGIRIHVEGGGNGTWQSRLTNESPGADTGRRRADAVGSDLRHALRIELLRQFNGKLPVDPDALIVKTSRGSGPSQAPGAPGLGTSDARRRAFVWIAEDAPRRRLDVPDAAGLYLEDRRNVVRYINDAIRHDRRQNVNRLLSEINRHGAFDWSHALRHYYQAALRRTRAAEPASPARSSGSTVPGPVWTRPEAAGATELNRALNDLPPWDGTPDGVARVNGILDVLRVPGPDPASRNVAADSPPAVRLSGEFQTAVASVFEHLLPGALTIVRASAPGQPRTEMMVYRVPDGVDNELFDAEPGTLVLIDTRAVAGDGRYERFDVGRDAAGLGDVPLALRGSLDVVLDDDGRLAQVVIAGPRRVPLGWGPSVLDERLVAALTEPSLPSPGNSRPERVIGGNGPSRQPPPPPERKVAPDDVRWIADLAGELSQDHPDPKRNLLGARYPVGVQRAGVGGPGAGWLLDAPPDSPGWRRIGSWDDLVAASAEAGPSGFTLARFAGSPDALAVHRGHDGVPWVIELSHGRPPVTMSLDQFLSQAHELPEAAAVIDRCGDVR